MAINNDTDIFILPIFSQYLSFWQIYCAISIILNRYLADTDIADIFLDDDNTDIQFADTDIKIFVQQYIQYTLLTSHHPTQVKLREKPNQESR